MYRAKLMSCLSVILVLSVLFTSCEFSASQGNLNTAISDSDSDQNDKAVTTGTPALVKDPLYTPYVESLGSDPDEKAKNLNWDDIISNITSCDYEMYPGYPTKPLKATLYKNGDIVELNVMDTRLIQMMNFYYNELHHGIYAYTTGSFSPEEVKSKIDAASVYLEIEYDPNSYYLNDSVDFYTGFDRLIVLPNEFIAIDSDAPFGGDVYPFTAFGRYPLSISTVDWPVVFGF